MNRQDTVRLYTILELIKGRILHNFLINAMKFSSNWSSVIIFSVIIELKKNPIIQYTNATKRKPFNSLVDMHYVI